MTATAFETDIDSAVENIVEYHEKIPEPCEGEYESGDCNNLADYQCMTKCCGTIILLCETCLFRFVEWAKRHENRKFRCARCTNEFVMHPNHIIVVGRV